MSKGTILAICAHNDDNIIGAGGTLVKYARQGKTVKTVIFSYGELSHPHLKKSVVKRMREKESIEADRIMGGAGLTYLGVSEGKFPQEIKEKGVKGKLLSIIKKAKPEKIFVHGFHDPHHDHHAVYKLVKELIDEGKISCPVYSFGVWNFMIAIRKTMRPRLVVDITDTFKVKVAALKAHKSQQLTILNLLWSVYVQAIVNGWNNRYKYAEVFYKMR